MIKLIILSVAFVFSLQFFSIICYKKSLPEFRFPNQIGGGVLIGYWLVAKIYYKCTFEAGLQILDFILKFGKQL